MDSPSNYIEVLLKFSLHFQLALLFYDGLLIGLHYGI